MTNPKITSVFQHLHQTLIQGTGISWSSLRLVIVPVMLILVLTFGASNLPAAPMELEFVQGLRERGYYDYALLYLERLQDQKGLAPDIASLLPLEKAIILLESAGSLKNPDAQNQQYDQAMGFLEEFVKKNPNHERANYANTERARILIGKAKVKTWQSQSPANVGVREKYQKEARQYILDARKVFQAAHDGYKAAFEKFPSSIAPDDKEQNDARDKAESLYMRAQLDLAESIYQEAQTYDAGSTQKNDLLIKATVEYDAIHSKYRSNLSGIYSRLMEGKCFEEQNDIRRALGIYQEILGHDARDNRLVRMQDQALNFKLICMNHPTRNDYLLVISEAEEWLTVNKGRAASESGLGIRWELTRAQEMLGNARSTAPADKDRLLKQALANAGEINRYPGPYQDVSFSMMQKLRVALNRDVGDPSDFDSAFGIANKMIEEIGKYKDRISQAEIKKQNQDVQNLQKELKAHLAETERIWRLALTLTTASTNIQQINTARYRLAYVLFLQRKNFDAAVIGEFLGIHFKTLDSTTALDASYLAMAALVQARNDALPDLRDELIPIITERCQFIADNWPDTDRAQDARMTLGRLLRNANKDLEAARYFQQVPESSDQYAIAQMEAGQSMWKHALVSYNPESTPETLKQIDQWTADARKLLENGIAIQLKKIPAKGTTPDEVVLAKSSLAQIMIRQGQDQQAIDILSNAPHSVLEAVKVADETKRSSSKTEIKGRTFASFVYQLLLRANVGAKKLNEARAARLQLEKIAGGEDSATLTAVYVELGRELQRELEALAQKGDKKRLGEVKTAFETFLQDLAQRTEGQSYGSLIWIAETYFSMAQGSKEDKTTAEAYYNQASKIYQQILTKAQSDPKFLEPGKVPGVKLRLVTCYEISGKFPEAETMIADVLLENSKALDAQLEAARLFQKWAEVEPVKYEMAIGGGTFPNKATMWGWGQIAKRLQIILQQDGNKEEDFQEKLYDALYQTTACRQQFAKTQPEEKRKLELGRAEFDLVTFTRTNPGLATSEWWPKYEEIYTSLQKDQGKVVSKLQKPNPIIQKTAEPKNVASGAGGNPGKPAVKSASNSGKKNSAATKAAPVSSSKTYLYLFVGIVLMGAVVGGIVVMSNKGGKKKSYSSSSKKPKVAPPVTAAPVATAAPQKVVRKKTTKPPPSAG
jgi:hypothetical protein